MAGLTALITLSGMTHIGAQLKGFRPLIYIAKPLTMLLIVAMAWQSPLPLAHPYKQAILGALGLSLIGDIFLMLPKERFVAGLASFLLAHLLYIYAFSLVQPNLVPNLGFALGALSIGYLTYLWPRLGRLLVPVLLYVAAIVAMAWYGLSWWLTSADMAAAYGALGACLFLFSDGCLGLRKFRGSYRYSPLLIMGSYFPAQWCFAVSLLSLDPGL